jgi:ubiquitin-conjugating enzyme E2 O
LKEKESQLLFIVVLNILPSKILTAYLVALPLSFMQHFETLVARHFSEREPVILEACGAYMSGTVVGSSACYGTKYACDKCFADFTRSLAICTEQLKGAFSANKARALELEREASSADEIVPASS